MRLAYFIGIFVVALVVGMLLLSVMSGLILAASVLVIYVALSLTDEVTADPPQVGVITFMGRMTREILKPGWHFVPRLLFGVILVDMKPRIFTVSVDSVTPDDGEKVEASITVTWKPREDAEGFVSFGKDDIVNKRLTAIITELTRNWLSSSDIGPHTWKEAYQMKDDLKANLQKRVEEAAEKELPITLNELNIGEIKATDEMLRVAEKKAKEDAEKESEKTELLGELALARMIVNAGEGKVDILVALKMVREQKAIREGHGIVISSPSGHFGLAEALVASAAGVKAAKPEESGNGKESAKEKKEGGEK